MRVLLSDIPLPRESKFGPFKRLGSAYPPINLLYLGTQLSKAGHKAQITTDDHSLDDVRAVIRETAPNVIGVTYMTLGSAYLDDFAAMVAAEAPHAWLIAGGYHASLFPEETLRRYPKILAVFKGEAERTIVPFINMLDSGSPDAASLREVKGIYFRDGDAIVATDPAPALENLDELPFPDFGLIPDYFSKYHSAVNRHYLGAPQAFLLTGRGCPFSCHFCGRMIMGRAIRQNSVEYRIELVQWLRDHHGVKSIVYGDEFLTLNKKESVRFCEQLRQKGLDDIEWCCCGRVSNMDYDFARELRNSGCRQIGYGCESGSQVILDTINKRVKVERMSAAIRDAHRAGLQVHGTFMLGCPGETRDTIEETRRFILSNPFGFVVLCFFTPLPGSYFWEEDRFLQYGTFANSDVSQFNLFSGIPFVPHGLSENDLRTARNRIYREFYFRPSRMARELKYLFNANSWRFAARVAGLTG